MHVVPGQPIGRGDEHSIKMAQRGTIAQALKARPLETGPAIPVIAEDVLRHHRPALAGGVRLQPIELLGNAVAPVRVALPPGGGPARVTVTLPGVTAPLNAGSRLVVSLATTDQGFDSGAAPASWRVSLADGRLCWSAQDALGRPATSWHEPDASLSRRVLAGLIHLLPVEAQL